MRDGQTQKIHRPQAKDPWAEFCDRFAAKVVVISGRESGSQFDIDRERLTIGRGPGVHVVLQDPAVSRQHAAIELVDGGFRVVDLGSTNGIQVDGESVQTAALQNGHRFEIGGRVMQLVIEEREATPDTYEISAEN